MATASDILGVLGAPENIDVTYPEVTETEKEIASMQLNIVEQLQTRIGDPAVKELIYSSLPHTDMNEKDLAKYTMEFANIKKEVTEAGVDLASKSYGRNIDQMVARGQIRKETADQMKIENQAAVSAMKSVYNKKLEANRISMARNYFINKGKLGLQTAGVVASVDSMNKRLYADSLSGLSNWYQNQRKAKLGMDIEVSKANMGNQQFINDVNMDFITSLASVGINKYGSIKADKQYQDLLKNLGLAGQTTEG